MLLLFPLVYVSSFLISIKELFSKNRQGILNFLIFGLPIYTTCLSISFTEGLSGLIPFLQPLKEILIIFLLILTVWNLKKRVNFLFIDYTILVYFAYNLLYVFLPVGSFTFLEKIVALKIATFFTLIYWTGRLTDIRTLFVSKYMHYILLVSIAAAVLLCYEIFIDTHFQTLTGYSDFIYYYFNQEAEGNYGLTWTFETSTGLKRFASFFANPLEYGAATIIAGSVLLALYTTDDNKFKFDAFGIAAVVACQLAIFFALSRASLGSYFVVIYVYSLITKRKVLLHVIHFAVVAALLYFIFFLFFINPDLYDFIYETITFTNPSSVGHIVAWLEGIEAMVGSPLGLGLGESGRLGNSEGQNVGGESQFIIIGVQTGVLMLLLYTFIHFHFIRTCWKYYPLLKGKNKKVCLALLLIKIGIIIPLFTSELESSIYISYITWFFSGLFINIIASPPSLKPATGPVSGSNPAPAI